MQKYYFEMRFYIYGQFCAQIDTKHIVKTQCSTSTERISTTNLQLQQTSTEKIYALASLHANCFFSRRYHRFWRFFYKEYPNTLDALQRPSTINIAPFFLLQISEILIFFYKNILNTLDAL
jgi:hypothetical protein